MSASGGCGCSGWVHNVGAVCGSSMWFQWVGVGEMVGKVCG